jgi:hypothetical protein
MALSFSHTKYAKLLHLWILWCSLYHLHTLKLNSFFNAAAIVMISS